MSGTRVLGLHSRETLQSWANWLTRWHKMKDLYGFHNFQVFRWETLPGQPIILRSSSRITSAILPMPTVLTGVHTQEGRISVPPLAHGEEEGGGGAVNCWVLVSVFHVQIVTCPIFWYLVNLVNFNVCMAFTHERCLFNQNGFLGQRIMNAWKLKGRCILFLCLPKH